MSREFQFENEKSVCWKTTIAPNLPLKMHRHDRLAPDPPNELHADINEGEEDVVVMVCEFKNEGEPATGAEMCECGGEDIDCTKCPGRFKGFSLEGNRASDNWHNWQPPTTKRE